MATVDAVLAVVGAYHGALASLCGSNYTGVCSSFLTNSGLNGLVATQLASLNATSLSGAPLRFRSGRDGAAGWLLLNRVGESFVDVAQWTDGPLTPLPALAARSSVYSAVSAACDPCTNCPAAGDRAEKFLLVPGQLYIGGIFNVHASGSVPLTCGDVNGDNGFLLTEVFKFALESLKTSSVFAGKLRGVTVGGLALDACDSVVRASALVANLHSGAVVLRDSALQKIDPERIMAYVAAAASDEAEGMLRVTDAVGVPVVSYGATAQLLSNKQQFPYFSRTVPSDARLASALAQLLRRYGLTNVQFVLSDTSSGSSDLRAVREAVGAEGICVNSVLRAGGGAGVTSTEADSLAAELLKRPSATAVVVFLPHDDLVELLAAVARNNATADSFLFIGSPTWSNRQSVLRKITNGKYPRAITFGFETGDINEFERAYLVSKTPSSYSANPWFNEFYESLYACSLNGSSTRYAASCASSSRSLTDSGRYAQDSLALYVVNAVYAAALGIHESLATVCGAAYNGVCSEFYAAGEKRQRVLAGVRSAVFVDATRQSFSIDAAGDSNRGYHLYELTSAAGAPAYVGIGAYNDTQLLKLRSDLRLAWASNCSVTADCSESCPRLGSYRSVYMQRNTSLVDLNIVQFLSVHAAGGSGADCGALAPDGGFNELLAFHFALEAANSGTEAALAGLTFGGISVDVCASASRAASLTFAYAGGSGLCQFANFSELLPPLTAVGYVANGDAVSAELAVALNGTATVVTPDATSVLLGDAAKYKRLLRVVPPQTLQLQALLDTASHFGWSVVSLLHDASSEGAAGRAAFESLLARRNATCAKFVRAASGAAMSPAEARAALQEANRVSYASVLILLLSQSSTRTLLAAIRDLGLRGRFVLMGLDSWADSQEIVAGLQEVAEGAITLRQTSFEVPALDAWATQLRLAPGQRKGVPADWLEEFWQHSQRCRIAGSSVMQPQYADVCDTTATLPPGTLRQDAGTLYTIVTTFVIAKGIANFKSAECGSQAIDVCLYSMPQAARQAALHAHIRSAQWQLPRALAGSNSSSLLFKFTEAGYGDVGYDVLNLVKVGAAYQYRKIGYWFEKLEVDAAQSLTLYGPDGTPLTSRPTSACPAGADCGCHGSAGSGGGGPLSLLPRPGVWQRASSAWGGIVLSLSILGAAATSLSLLFLAVAFPRRQGGTRGTNLLGFGCLGGVLLLYCLCPTFVAHATPAVCGLRRFGLAVAHSVAAACLLVRSVALWSLQRGEIDFAGVSHPRGLLCIAGCICALPAALCAQWLIVVPPDAGVVAYDGVAWSRCAPGEFYDAALALSCLPPAAFALAAGAFSLAAWGSADARHSALAVLLGSVALAVSLLVACLAEFKWRDPAMAVGTWACATVLLLCLFAHKLLRLCRLRRQSEKTVEMDDF